MSTLETPGYGTWTLPRLTAQQRHLESILPMLNERDDPEKPQMRAELAAIREEIASRPTPEEIGAKRAAELLANGADENWLGAR